MLENTDNKPKLLSPSDKFIEIQKQDWQIEALVIGSVILK
jgi:hypothetical protein